MAWRRGSGGNGLLAPAGTRPAPATSGRSGVSAGAAPAAGVIGGRLPGLPRGRAVLGGLFVAAAAVIIFAGSLSAVRGQHASFVVATQPLPAGTILAPGDMGTATFSLPGSTRSQAFRDPGALIGRTLSAPVTPGELLQAGMLAPAGGPPLRPVSISVDPTSLDGLSAGEPVDVMLTTVSPDGTSAGTSPPAAAGGAAAGSGPAAVSVVLRGAALLSIAKPASGLTADPTSATVVTLGVTDLSQVEMLEQASHSGTVTLVQAEPSDGTGPGPGPTG